MKAYREYSPCFDDILLIPQYSDIDSRHDVDISTKIGESVRSINLGLPIVAAPMDTVCEVDMAIAMRRNGGLGIIHRYLSVEEQSNQVCHTKDSGFFVGAAVGAKDHDFYRALVLCEAGAGLILVDTANGHSEYAIKAVAALRKSLGHSIHIMTGNVSTYDGFMALADAGADSIRVGIGGGGMCTTRIVTGHGMPTLSSIIDIREALPKGTGPSIVADGGIKNSGDAVKALAAGADAVMIGSALAGTQETPGDLIFDGDKSYKMLRGMASESAQKDWRGSVSVVEGAQTRVTFAGPVQNVLDSWAGGIRSGLSYTGVRNLNDLHAHAQYVGISSVAVAENKPHATR